jgi:CRP/FNR family transcriptional regulator, anaerobic regulatory protein
MQSNFPIIRSSQEEVQFKNLLDNYGISKKIQKGKTVIREGDKSDFFFYVVSGGFKSYITKGDRDYILGFSFADNIDCCPYSLFSKQQNTYTLEAYSDSEIILVKMYDLEKFSKSEIGFGNFVQDSLVDYIGLIETTLFDLISKTAEERYNDLLTNYKNQLTNISLADIAKYLGITQERLSRIRKKIL